MHVKHSNPYTDKVGHGGREYKALREGIFEVPDPVGHELLAQPGWTRYYGEAPYEVSSEEPATEPEPRRARSRSQKADAE